MHISQVTDLCTHVTSHGLMFPRSQTYVRRSQVMDLCVLGHIFVCTCHRLTYTSDRLHTCFHRSQTYIHRSQEKSFCTYNTCHIVTGHKPQTCIVIGHIFVSHVTKFCAHAIVHGLVMSKISPIFSICKELMINFHDSCYQFPKASFYSKHMTG